MATKVKENEEAENEREGSPDGPLLDLSDDAVKKMIKAAKKRGYVTMDELNEVLPSDQVDPDRIEDIMAMLNDMGINVIEDEDVEEAAAPDDDSDDEESDGGEIAPATGTALATAKKKEPTDRTDDPVRMYLREMGSVELLSREGEIEIAKRIEAGREMMIGGLCECPQTYRAIIAWRDSLLAGKMLLRDVIDLDATYGRSPDAALGEGEGELGEAELVEGEAELEEVEGEVEGEGEAEENAVSLAAMEAQLKPQILETFEQIADQYHKLAKVQEKRIIHTLKTRLESE